MQDVLLVSNSGDQDISLMHAVTLGAYSLWLDTLLNLDVEAKGLVLSQFCMPDFVDFMPCEERMVEGMGDRDVGEREGGELGYTKLIF